MRCESPNGPERRQYAAESLTKAEVNLQTAEDYQAHRGNQKSEITAAREAVQTAEDARIITVKKIMRNVKRANSRLPPMLKPSRKPRQMRQPGNRNRLRLTPL